MTLDFFVNNLRFAIDLSGAVAFLMATWLTLDTYNVRKEISTLIRAMGFGALALAEVISAVAIGNDLLSYISSSLIVVGLVFIAGSFLHSQQLQAQAVLVIPTFSQWRGYLSGLQAALF